MKKIYLFLLITLCFRPAFSQEKVIYAAEDNFKQEMTALFDRADRAARAPGGAAAAFAARTDSAALPTRLGKNSILTSESDKETAKAIDRFIYKVERESKQQQEFAASGSAARAGRHKKWQVAFMIMNFLPRTALMRLQNKVDEGTVQRASFLVWDELEKPEEEDMTLAGQLSGAAEQKLKGAFYMIYATPKGAVTESIRFCVAPRTEAVLDLLFKNLKLNSSDLNTALVLVAHGEGSTMTDGKGMFAFEIDEVMEKVKESRLHLDILDLESCHMGSLRALYLMAQGGRVDYALVASDLGASSVWKRDSRLLRFLNLGPKRAVTQTVSSIVAPPIPVAHANELAYDVQALREPLLQWIRHFAAAVKHGPQDMRKNLIDGKDEASYYLLDDLVREQIEYVETRLDVRDPVNKAFLDSSWRLLLALKTAKLAQWCLREANCIKGISYRPGDILYIWAEHGVYLS